ELLRAGAVVAAEDGVNGRLDRRIDRRLLFRLEALDLGRCVLFDLLDGRFAIATLLEYQLLQQGDITGQFRGECHAAVVATGTSKRKRYYATWCDFSSQPERSRRSSAGVISTAGLPARGNWNSHRSSRL